MSSLLLPTRVRRAQQLANAVPQMRPKAPVVSGPSIADVELAQVPSLDECAPGFRPVEYNVVIAPATQAERIGSILLSDETRERQETAVQVGRLVAVSPFGFSYERWPEGARPPQPGDIVLFARYAGGKVRRGPTGAITASSRTRT